MIFIVFYVYLSFIYIINSLCGESVMCICYLCVVTKQTRNLIYFKLIVMKFIINIKKETFLVLKKKLQGLFVTRCILLVIIY